MSERVRVKVLLLFGDQAEVQADAPDATEPQRYPAAQVAAESGVPAAQLPGTRLTAVAGPDGRLSQFRQV